MSDALLRELIGEVRALRATVAAVHARQVLNSLARSGLRLTEAEAKRAWDSHVREVAPENPAAPCPLQDELEQARLAIASLEALLQSGARG